MRTRLLLALGLVVGLAAIFWWSSRTRGPESTLARLASFDDRSVTALALGAGEESCRVVREGDRWRVAAPVADAASAAAIEEILIAARGAPILREMQDAAPASGFGLSPPQVRVALEGVPAPAIDVGSRVPTGEGVYARVSGRPGVVVLRLPDAAALATARCALLRDPSLLGAQASEIAGLDLSPDGPKLRRDGGTWWIETPRRLPASPARIDALVAALARATIVLWDDRGDAAEPRFGLAAGRRITLTTVDGARGTVTLGAEAGEGRRFATRSGRHGVLTVALPALPGTSLEALRETKLTNVNRYRVVEIDYEEGTRRFTARRSGGSWTGSAGPLSEDAVLALLVGLLEAKTASSDAGALPAGPRATISYATDDGARGRVEVASGLAAWSEAPGSIFRLEAPLPAVPGGQ